MSTVAEPMPMDTALVPMEKGTPLPVFPGREMTAAVTAYRELQTALDQSMPDQIMELDGKPFRKKGYWRAIAVAFNLTVEPITEQREVHGLFDDGRENFGYIVTYRASTASRAMSGDGACFAVEKGKRRGDANPWATLPHQASEHNVRSHAHTRAFNRAVSNLVGFGEVSAEEVDRDEGHGNGHAAPAPTPPMARSASGQVASASVISEAQAKRFFAIAVGAGWKAGALKEWVKSKIGVDDDRQIPRNVYDRLCTEVKDEAPR